MKTTTQLAEAASRAARLRSRICSFPLDADLPKGLAEELSEAKIEVRRLSESMPAQVGLYSGLTRAELAKTGTCETDWA